jgi:hypothetical protein
VEDGVFIKFTNGGFYGESIVALDSNICTLRFGLGVKGGLYVGGAPKMHNILGLSRAKHLHLGR